ncbi:MAG: M20 family metallo-hydrolase [Aigarchaeota archaeon]|nr:M20 family metallo-hydrolase [Aigarchaeota archaeon]
MNEIVRKVEERSRVLLDDVIKSFIELLEISAVNPSSGGRGEGERAEKLEAILRNYDLDKLFRVDAYDERVKDGVRPNIIGLIHGEDKSKTLWLVAHIDTVPEGDITLWKTDPFKPVIKDGKIFARGAEDNGQAIASILLTVKIIKELNLTPKYNLGLVFASDEEAGSKYGLQYLVEKKVFKKDDEAVVLDFGAPDGSEIEVAEKHLLWLKFTVHGIQAHAAFPHEGINAHRIGVRLISTLDQILHERFSEVNQIFIPPTSTFEPTKKEHNVDNVNTVPGKDIFYFDCRVLPSYNLKQVLEIVNSVCRSFESLYNVKIDLEEHLRWESPPPTPPDSSIVKKLSKAIKLSRNIETKIIGIGGGTCAAFLRAENIPAVVWSTLDRMAHKPNEYCRIENIRKDAEVLALLSIIS